MLRIFNDTHFDFLGKRKIAYTLSIILIAAGIALMITGGLKKGIDFAGGVLLELRFTKNVPINDIRNALADENIANAEIQQIGKNNDVLVRVPHMEGIKADSLAKAALRNKFPDAVPAQEKDWIRSQEVVSPKIGDELTVNAIWAIFASLALIILYIWWRFRFTFGIAAVIALFHDVLITLAFFAITGKEISLPIVAALLTIVGYSLNDTIVVFDRIREGIKIYFSKDYKYVLNQSINETLNRTVLTSLTTFVVVFILYLFGGGAINDFAFALMIGVLVGTYSSIFVASSLLFDWQRIAAKKAKK